ncbi:MAG: succinyl-CoA synthetase alpha subunit [Betaproteobacteria bacterium]|jgi:succinyl-CoA synthetase alpha subunit|nr:succinyl-CoA synthetase alpha subunit [Betaproteobacteria bacterium]
MSVLVDASSRVLIYGIAGNFGRFSARDIAAYGTKVVAGVAPGRDTREVEGVPVFQNARSACASTDADVALVYVPAPAALDAVLEVLDAGCKVVVYPGDGLPVQDAVEIRAAARRAGAVLVGPNTPGVISPGKAKLGFMPSFCYTPGALGVISRSGSLSYEAGWRLTSAGLGQTSVIGIGGDPVKGLNAGEAIDLLHADAETEAILYLGEIGGADEYAVARYAERDDAKPTAALIVGASAPPGKKMGHAAALVGSKADTQAAKVEALRISGVHVAANLRALVDAAQAALRQRETITT